MSSGDHQDLNVYNPSTNEWSLVKLSGSLVTPSTRDAFGFTSTAGNLYLFGGENSDFYPGNSFCSSVRVSRKFNRSFAVYYNDLYKFDMSSVEWATLNVASDTLKINEDRPFPRIYLGMASTDTHLFVFGGWGGTGALTDAFCDRSPAS